MTCRTEIVDVLVLGAGMAGTFAAIAAISRTNRVVLVEATNVIGGQGTAGGVAGFCGDTAHVNHAFDQLVERLGKHDMIQPYSALADRRNYDLEYCAFVLQEMVTERNIELLLHSRVADVEHEDGKITRVSVACSGVPLVFEPRVVIDATGDCHAAYLAGFDTIHEPALKQLPMSLYFTLWDTAKKVVPFLPDGCPTWTTDKALPMTSVHECSSGKVEVKMKIVGFDAADGFSLSQAELAARRQMMGLIYYLQTHGYAGKVFDRYVLAGVSRMIGIREQRRIVGEHILTEDDITHGAVFDDAVVVGTYHLDYHWPDKSQRAGTGITTMVEPYHIPLRSLIPKGAKNMLVAGRAASGDQMAMSSYRVMATCVQMGYAAGKAAAMCIEEDCSVNETPVKKLQKELIAEGQLLDLSSYGEYLRQKMTIYEHVFEDDRPFESCHASTLVQLSNGRFLVSWFAGSAEGNPDVGIWLEDRCQGRWSKPSLLCNSPGEANWNPVLFRGPDGEVRLFFKVANHIEKWRTLMMVSKDQGKTWSPPHELIPGNEGGRGPVKNKPIILSDGSWLAPASLEVASKWDAFVDRSEDDGQTWKASDLIPINRHVIGGVIQPTLWESQPGHVHMLLRRTNGHICRSDSADYGKTWCPSYKTNLPNNNSGIDIAKLNNGALALVYNHVRITGLPSLNKRTPLSVSLSFDNGKTWPRRLDLETEEGEFSYPAIISTQRGMAITYTWKRRRIAFWHGSIESIPEVRS